VGVTLNTKTGEKIDTFDMDALLHHRFGGEHGIQAPRN
jgi:hypothetical protein